MTALEAFRDAAEQIRADINANPWVDDIYIAISENEGVFHVYACVSSHDSGHTTDCVEAVSRVLDEFAKDRQAFIRVRPMVTVSKNFLLDRPDIAAYVRFSFVDKPGVWQDFSSEHFTVSYLGTHALAPTA